MARRTLLLAAVFAVLALYVSAPEARAQQINPRFGLGVQALISTPDGLGMGLRGRLSAPVNADLSFAADLGVTGFFLEGRQDATVLFDPQVSAIITLPPGPRRTLYLLTGVGAYLPMNDGGDTSGPTIHFGVGAVRSLTETTLFYEFDPALIIDADRLHLAIPFRVGVIF